jgi:hypothetical protein
MLGVALLASVSTELGERDAALTNPPAVER